jgi:1-acyl-sn-glycerol-3-phosphate acyltransferase
MSKVVQYFSKMCFWLFGWKVVSGRPDLKKYVLIVAPHTSNWDFFVGLAARSISGIKSNFLIKDSVMKTPIIGSIVRSIGGRAVDRSKKTGMVDQIVEMYEREEELVITITPEGTRSYNPKWKSGFYQIALNAKVPIQMVAFDFEHKQVVFRELFYPTGDVEGDIEAIKTYYRGFKGRHPEKGVL